MKCEKCKKIAEIVENMYDTIILEPLNEIDIHRYYIEKLCKIFGYNKHSLKTLKEIRTKKYK